MRRYARADLLWDSDAVADESRSGTSFSDVPTPSFSDVPTPMLKKEHTMARFGKQSQDVPAVDQRDSDFPQGGGKDSAVTFDTSDPVNDAAWTIENDKTSPRA